MLAIAAKGLDIAGELFSGHRLNNAAGLAVGADLQKQLRAMFSGSLQQRLHIEWLTETSRYGLGYRLALKPGRFERLLAAGADIDGLRLFKLPREWPVIKGGQFWLYTQAAGVCMAVTRLAATPRLPRAFISARH